MSAVATLPPRMVEASIRTPERWERSLAKREVFVLDTDRPLALACLDGLLWVTIDGDLADYVLEPGMRLRLDGGGKATVQSLRPARFAVGRG